MILAIATEPAPLRTNNDGVVYVAKTRVTLDTVVTAFLEGATAESVQEQYPVLELSDIYIVIGYYLKHQSEINAYIAERQRKADAIRQEAEQRFNPVGIRARLLSRRQPEQGK